MGFDQTSNVSAVRWGFDPSLGGKMGLRPVFRWMWSQRHVDARPRRAMLRLGKNRALHPGTVPLHHVMECFCV